MTGETAVRRRGLSRGRARPHHDAHACGGYRRAANEELDEHDRLLCVVADDRERDEVNESEHCHDGEHRTALTAARAPIEKWHEHQDDRHETEGDDAETLPLESKNVARQQLQ